MRQGGAPPTPPFLVSCLGEGPGREQKPGAGAYLTGGLVALAPLAVFGLSLRRSLLERAAASDGALIPPAAA